MLIDLMKEDNEYGTSMGDAISSDKIKDNLVLHTLNLISASVDEKMPIPRSLEQNKYLWGRILLKNKKLQDVLTDFTLQVKTLIEKELATHKSEI